MEPYIEIKLKHIIENYKYISKETNKNVIAIIKDNAYGHGLIKVGQILSQNNVFMLGVSSLSEAISLRKNMIFSPVIILSPCLDSKTLFSFKLTPCITSISQLESLAKDNLPIPIHLGLNTGMNRLGINENEIDLAITIIKKSRLLLKGIYTHYCQDNSIIQSEIFLRCITKFKTFSKLIIHTQASKYIDRNLDFTNTVRIGLSLYGYSPYFKLKPALSFYVPIIYTTKIKANTPIGYSPQETINKDGYILTMPIGYATCFARMNKLCFFYENTLIMQVGLSCMDMTMFFSSFPIKENTYINFLENKNIDSLLALNSESIYYLLASLNSNIKRIYH